MTGLIGYFSRGGVHDPLQVAGHMGDRMQHQSYYRLDIGQAGATGALGCLNIGIFNKNPQPIYGADGEITLVLVGEFYHQESLRRKLERCGTLAAHADDTELALKLYLDGGVDALTSLDGMFVIAIWDARAGNVWIINDRYGLYPHYYSHHNCSFSLAPEINGVLAAPDVPGKLDLVAVAQYAQFQQVLGERTWFDDVHLLPPAIMLNYRPAEDRLTLHKYWDWDQVAPQPATISIDEAAEEATMLFERAINARIQAPHRVGIFLSGGLDGRGILGFARDHVDISTFTFGSSDCLDVRYARELARRSGTDHHWFSTHDGQWVLDHHQEHLALTEGFHSWMHAHGMNVLRSAREHVDVNLSGWDGATVLGGYIVVPGGDDEFRHPPDEMALARRFFTGFSSEFVWPGLTDEEAGYLFSEPGNPGLRGLAFDSMRDELARTAHYPPPNRADYFYMLQHCRRSTQNMIVFTRSAVEVRSPYFDYDFITFLYGLPERLRNSLDLQHLLLTRRMPDLARVPSEKDGLPPHSSRVLRNAHRSRRRAIRAINRFAPIIPDRPRLYADYENYLRNELAGWAEEILFAPQTLDRGLFNPAAVQELWERHQRGDQLWTIGKVAPLITLELVLRRFVDGDWNSGVAGMGTIKVGAGD